MDVGWVVGVCDCGLVGDYRRSIVSCVGFMASPNIRLLLSLLWLYWFWLLPWPLISEVLWKASALLMCRDERWWERVFSLYCAGTPYESSVDSHHPHHMHHSRTTGSRATGSGSTGADTGLDIAIKKIKKSLPPPESRPPTGKAHEVYPPSSPSGPPDSPPP